MASSCCCVLVIDSSWQPNARLGEVPFDDPGGSRTVFEVGRVTSSEEILGAIASAPMETPSNLQKCFRFYWKVWDRLILVVFHKSSCYRFSSLRSS